MKRYPTDDNPESGSAQAGAPASNSQAQADKIAGRADAPRSRTLHVEVLMDLLRTSFLVRRHFNAVMKGQGITGQQYNVLRILRGAGEPLPTMEVSARMIEPEPGITRLIRRLEMKGLVRRVQGSDDARHRLCTVTEEGLRVLADLDHPVEAANRRLTGTLDPEERRTAIDLLGRIRDAAVRETE